MPKKTDKLFEKIVKKDYNNELEKILEKKYFDENVKSILLSILYKIETAYKDYEKVKQNVENKEEFIQNIINNIRDNCNDIKIIKLNSKESEMLGKKTFLVEKNRKRIICYPIERKLLYCISKISKNEKIIKDKYVVIDKTLSDLINVGNNINTVEPMRDFNGYSWTTIPREIESIYHNLIYQNIRMLVGNEFLNHWLKNSKSIIDYFEEFQNNLESQYGDKKQKEIIETLNKLSVLLAFKYNPKLKTILQKEEREVKTKLNKIRNNGEFVQELTQEKKNLTSEIKYIDETINNKKDLQEEYERRNEYLPLEEKIFSVKILSKLMLEEREKKLRKLESINKLLNPQNFVKYKKELENKEKYLKFINIEDKEKEIKKSIIDLQKLFLYCYTIKIKNLYNKQELIKLIYELRYYCFLPITEEELVGKKLELADFIKKVQMLLLEKAHELKVIDYFSTEKEIDYQILKNIFFVRVINLEDLYLKVTKEKEKYYIQLFDENIFEEKMELEGLESINKKDITFKINKKIKIFN